MVQRIRLLHYVMCERPGSADSGDVVGLRSDDGVNGIIAAWFAYTVVRPMH